MSFITKYVIYKKGKSKNLIIRYNPLIDKFIVYIPIRTSQKKLDIFLQERVAWMQKIQVNLPNRVYFNHGEIIPILGENHIIRVNNGNINSNKNILDIIAYSNIEQQIKGILYYKLNKYLEIKTANIENIIGKKAGRISIKETISRWGSCGENSHISFSWRLVFAPLNVLNYVIIHEFSHLIHLNHSAKFWKLVGELQPDYEQAIKWIKQNSEKLYRYGEPQKIENT